MEGGEGRRVVDELRQLSDPLLRKLALLAGLEPSGKRPEVLERLSVACALEPEPSSATQPASTTSRPGATTSDARDDDDDADSFCSATSDLGLPLVERIGVVVGRSACFHGPEFDSSVSNPHEIGTDAVDTADAKMTDFVVYCFDVMVDGEAVCTLEQRYSAARECHRKLATMGFLLDVEYPPSHWWRNMTESAENRMKRSLELCKYYETGLLRLVADRRAMLRFETLPRSWWTGDKQWMGTSVVAAAQVVRAKLEMS